MVYRRSYTYNYIQYIIVDSSICYLYDTSSYKNKIMITTFFIMIYLAVTIYITMITIHNLVKYDYVDDRIVLLFYMILSSLLWSIYFTYQLYN